MSTKQNKSDGGRGISDLLRVPLIPHEHCWGPSREQHSTDTPQSALPPWAGAGLKFTEAVGCPTAASPHCGLSRPTHRKSESQGLRQGTTTVDSTIRNSLASCREQSGSNPTNPLVNVIVGHVQLFERLRRPVSFHGKMQGGPPSWTRQVDAVPSPARGQVRETLLKMCFCHYLPRYHSIKSHSP